MKNFDFNKMENNIVRYGKEKIAVKPIISVNDKMLINELCIRQFVDGVDLGFFRMPMVRSLFDMVVLFLQTDIYVDGIKIVENGDSRSIELDCTSTVIEKYEESGIFEIVKKAIVNYKETWDCVVESINLKNTYNALSIIANEIPSVEDIKSSVSMLKEFAEQNPELVKKIALTQAVENARASAKQEVVEAVKTEKAEVAKKRSPKKKSE